MKSSACSMMVSVKEEKEKRISRKEDRKYKRGSEVLDKVTREETSK